MRPALINTEGLDVLVQLVIAAIAIAPWLSVLLCLSSITIETSKLFLTNPAINGLSIPEFAFTTGVFKIGAGVD